MTQNQQLATFALQLVNRSTAATDDNTQAGIAAVKQWLGKIASGEVIVGTPAPAKPEKVKKK